MWFKHRAWIPIAWLLSLANLGAVWFAALPGEPYVTKVLTEKLAPSIGPGEAEAMAVERQDAAAARVRDKER